MPNRDAVSLCAQVSEQWIAYFHVISQTYIVPSRFDVDDCVQECCLELSILINEMDPTDPEFPALLKTRVFRRLIDMHRAEHYSNRDVRRTSPIEDEQFVEDADPSLVVEAKEMEVVIEKNLTSQQRLVWRELVQPGRSLRHCFTAYREKRGRACHEVPVSVYAEATGLTNRQVRHALESIRGVARQVFSTEGAVPCLC